MIFRIKFKAKVGKETLYDEMKIAAKTSNDDRQIFGIFIRASCGLKGKSGIYYPLGEFGSVKLKSIKKIST